eukprot:TRINITY_DN7549_c0_g2_i4.p1 TRINITY_DN7549_c0_g2~~TRINITY_DN7549_c0_g2_i4.p1  ORF type:complete len:122 (+),score=0.62 TRINITY_DN7549_c0_g2_i4:291-656(+)
MTNTIYFFNGSNPKIRGLSQVRLTTFNDVHPTNQSQLNQFFLNSIFYQRISLLFYNNIRLDFLSQDQKPSKFSSNFSIMNIQVYFPDELFSGSECIVQREVVGCLQKLNQWLYKKHNQKYG